MGFIGVSVLWRSELKTHKDHRHHYLKSARISLSQSRYADVLMFLEMAERAQAAIDKILFYYPPDFDSKHSLY